MGFCVIFLSALVSLLAKIRKTTLLIFTKFGGKVVSWSRKTPLDSGGNLDYVTVRV